MNKNRFWWLLTLLIIFIIFLPSLYTYFVQDDFWLLSISQVTNLKGLGRLFIPEAQVVWYRPLSSQVFFALGQWLFSFNPLPYHLAVFATHLITSYLLFRFLKLIQIDRSTSFLAAFFYAIHQAHTISLSWLAAYSFILGPLFILLTMISFLRMKFKWMFFFGLLGMLVNEVNLLIPLFLIPMTYFDVSIHRSRTKKWFLIILLALVGTLLIYIRKIAFPTSVTTELYQLHLTNSIVTTLKFYILRILNVPLLFDEMPLAYQIVILLLNILFVGGVGWGAYQYWQKKAQLLRVFLYFTGIGLLPFVFLPQHLAPHYLSFAFLGAAPIFAQSVIFIKKYNAAVFYLVVMIFVFLQLIGIQETYNTHWIFRRAQMAEKLIKSGNLIHPVGSEEYFTLGAGSAAKLFP